jgi:hypothetical protein
MIGDMDVAWSKRLPRRRMIKKFCAKQRQNKRWVSFWELVELYARPSRSREGIKKSEDEAFKKLAIALCRGEFGRQVLYLTDRPGLSWRMTPDWFEAALEIHPWKILRRGWLEPCWVPVGAAIAWCRSCRIEVPPGWPIAQGYKLSSLASAPSYSTAEVPTPAVAVVSRRTKQGADGAKRGPVRVYDWDRVRAAGFRILRKRGGPPSEDGDPGWRSRSDFEKELADSCVSIFDRQPAKSTLQGMATKCLQAWAEREKADN